eukprot:3273439-Prymnesium_polylepis.1
MERVPLDRLPPRHLDRQPLRLRVCERELPRELRGVVALRVAVVQIELRRLRHLRPAVAEGPRDDRDQRDGEGEQEEDTDGGAGALGDHQGEAARALDVVCIVGLLVARRL